jgi:hypothetical protein
VVDVVTVYKSVTDMRDFKEYKATLLEDGTGFTLMEPSVPRFFLDAEDLHDLEGKDMVWEIKKDHLLHSTAIEKRHNRQSKEGTFHFPDGVCCTALHFDNQPNGTLQNQFRVHQVESKEGSGKFQDVAYIFWKMTVDQEARHTRNHKKVAESLDPLALAYERMSLSKKNKKSSVEEKMTD